MKGRECGRTERIVNLLAVPAALYTLFLLFRILTHTFADAGIPNEYREAANVFLTRELLSGRNPYAREILRADPPGLIYLYGPLYSAAVALIRRVVPVDLMLLHYLFTFACVLLSAVLSAWIVAEHTKTFTAPVLAFLFLLHCHWRYNYVNAVPDSMALFLMVLILFILSRENFRHKALISAVLTVAVFFTKQYFLLIAGTAAAFFFLFESWKDFLKYLLYGFMTFALSALLIRRFFPLFWTYVLYLAMGPGYGVSNHVTRNGVRVTGNMYNLSQIMSIGGLFLMLFIAGAAGGVITLFRRRMERIDWLLFGHLAVAGICLLHLGKNDGAWLSYYLELFMPALVMEAVIMLERYLPEEGSRPRQGLYLLFYLVFILFTIFRTDTRLKASPLSAEDYAAWQEAESVMCENEGEQYLYPLLAYHAIRTDGYVYNTGQPFVLSRKFYRKYLASERARKLFPEAGTLFLQHFRYRKEIRRKVRHGDYSMVSWIPGRDEVFDGMDLRLHYRKEKTLSLRTGRQVWEVEFWVPKAS